MTRTDVMASSRPGTPVGAARIRSGSSGVWRGLAIAAVAMAVALVPSVAIATSEPTAGYKSTPTVSKTTPSSGVAPAKEEKPTTSTPAKETAPATTSSTPTSSEKASTLPFTGFDLRWDIGLGLLLIAAGVSIVVLQRRQRRERQH
jgi:hypothetical protein